MPVNYPSKPENPRYVAIRPLNKGMILNRPSQALPPGALVEAANFIVGTRGPLRRPGWNQYAGNDTVDSNMVDLGVVWDTSGGQVLFLLTDKFFYSVNPSTGLTVKKWTYDTGTVDVDGAGTGVDKNSGSIDWEANHVKPEDEVEIGSETALVNTVDSATQITLASAITGSQTGVSYSIHRRFNTDSRFMPDWTVARNKLVIADFNHPLIGSNSPSSATTLTEWSTGTDRINGSETVTAACVEFFRDRLWVGHTTETTDGERRQRLRWTKITDERDFSTDTAFVDLPYVSGALRRIVPLSNVLVLYFDDGVFVGNETNVPSLPFAFQQRETGGIGLVGNKAVCRWLDGHFWVGQDDIYYLSIRGFERIGTPVVQDTIRQCENRERIFAVPDPENQRICFGFPESSTAMTKVWSYDYIQKVWSFDEFDTKMVANPLVDFTLQWDNLTGSWNALGDSYPTWDSMIEEETRRSLYSEWSGSIRQLSTERATDYDSGGNLPITARLITQDFDFGRPDKDKTLLRVSIKIGWNTALSDDLTFGVFVSPNKGRDYFNKGTLSIPQGSDEGIIDFQVTASTFRIKLESTSAVEPYWIDEIVLGVVGRGLEETIGNQAVTSG